MKKVVALMLACVIALLTSMTTVHAEENSDLSKHQISTSKREKILLARELDINPNQIRNIRKKSFNSTTTNKLAHIESIDDNGNTEIEPVDIEITEVLVSDNTAHSQQASSNYRPAKYTILKASEEKKTEKSKKGLSGYIKWIDNFGPMNELKSVYGSANMKKSGYIRQYSYGIGGLAGSIHTYQTSKYDVGKSNIGLKGLSFSFDFVTKKTDQFKEKTLIIITSVTD